MMIYKKNVKITIKQSQIVLFRDLNDYQIDTYRSNNDCKNTRNTDQDSFYDILMLKCFTETKEKI